MLDLEEFTEANWKRCNLAFPECNDWLIVDWSNAVCGEAGEMANIVKKIRRGDMALQNPDDKQKLAYEMADIVTYVSLMAAKMGIILEAAIVEKFNLVSDKRMCPIKMVQVKGYYKMVVA